MSTLQKQPLSTWEANSGLQRCRHILLQGDVGKFDVLTEPVLGLVQLCNLHGKSPVVLVPYREHTAHVLIIDHGKSAAILIGIEGEGMEVQQSRRSAG